MARWTSDELDLLIGAAAMSLESLTRLLPRHSPLEIVAVRAAIHRSHLSEPTEAPSRLIRRRLQVKQGTVVCSECSTRI